MASDGLETEVRELLENRVFSLRCLLLDELEFPLLECILNFVSDILLETPDEEILDLFAGVFLGIGDSRWLEKVHEAREALRPAVVRRCRGQNQGIARAAKEAPQPCPLRLVSADGDVLAFVDDHHIPMALLEIALVFLVPLERVDRNDDLVEVVKGIHVGRDPRLHALDAHRVEPHQGDREPRPEFLLELAEYRLEGHHKDAVGPAALDELGEEHADLDGLAETDAIRHEDTRAKLPQGFARRLKLVVRRADRAAGSHIQGIVRGGRAPQERIEVEARPAILG